MATSLLFINFLVLCKYGIQLKLHFLQKYLYNLEETHERFPNQPVQLCQRQYKLLIPY